MGTSRVEKLEDILTQLGRVIKSFTKMKEGAIDIQRNDIAAKSTAIIKNANELYDIFKSSQDAIILDEINRGVRRQIEVVNLDKPTLTLIRGGKQ